MLFSIFKPVGKAHGPISRGKEATIALLGEGDFMGEGCIASDQPLRTASATAITDCYVLRIEKDAMLKVLHRRARVFRPVCRVSRSSLQPDSGRLG